MSAFSVISERIRFRAILLFLPSARPADHSDQKALGRIQGSPGSAGSGGGTCEGA